MGPLSASTAKALRKANIERLKAEIAEAQEQGNIAEAEEHAMWDEYDAEQRRFKKEMECRRVARDQRMSQLKSLFAQLPTQNGSWKRFDSTRWDQKFNQFKWSKQSGAESPPLASKLERIIARLRGGTVFDAEVENKRWQEFEERAQQGNVRLQDLPIPAHCRAISTRDFKEMALRFHPDKFMQRFGCQLCEEETEAILEAVVAIFQEVNNARCS